MACVTLSIHILAKFSKHETGIKILIYLYEQRSRYYYALGISSDFAKKERQVFSQSAISWQQLQSQRLQRWSITAGDKRTILCIRIYGKVN